MIGLIIKDIINLKKSIMTTLFIILVYSFFSYNTGDMSLLIGMTVFIMTSMSISSMAYDDMAKWDSYALAMPVTRRDIVLSKYLLALIFCIIAVIVSSIFAIIITYVKGDLNSIIDIQEILLIAYTVSLVCLIFISIITPLIFKFGVENARMLMVGAIIVPMGIGYFLVKMGIQPPTLEDLKRLLYISPIILVMVLILSITITYGIYKNKDM
ncbi:MAG: ABC-2 transporter permease [Tissierellaceae bacterium]|nr:ABC-2 transporter permease [Tissierellaceae bacterium]